jgi:hypothetical protein
VGDRARFIPTREWVGERCFILFGGESLKAQRSLVPQLKGRFIAVKQTVAIKPDADVMFVGARDDVTICAPFFTMYTGPRIICRSPYDGFPEGTLLMSRTKETARLCKTPGVLAGLDTGTSAINLAYQLGVSEIVLLGYDMRGGRWLNGEFKHPLPFPPKQHFDRHLLAAKGIAADLEAEGVKVWNASPKSAATFFFHRALETFL